MINESIVGVSDSIKEHLSELEDCNDTWTHRVLLVVVYAFVTVIFMTLLAMIDKLLNTVYVESFVLSFNSPCLFCVHGLFKVFSRTVYVDLRTGKKVSKSEIISIRKKEHVPLDSVTSGQPLAHSTILTSADNISLD